MIIAVSDIHFLNIKGMRHNLWVFLYLSFFRSLVISLFEKRGGISQFSYLYSSLSKDLMEANLI